MTSTRVWNPDSATYWRVDTHRRRVTAEFLYGTALYSFPPLEDEMALLLRDLVDAGISAMRPNTRPRLVSMPGPNSQSFTVWAPVKLVPQAERALIDTLTGSTDPGPAIAFLQACDAEATRWSD